MTVYSTNLLKESLVPPASMMETEESVGSSRVGSRVCVGRAKCGVLMFYGATEFADGNWCGVALDEPVGKHNGLVGNTRYFSCAENHGIFAPPSKVEIIAAPASTNDCDSKREMEPKGPLTKIARASGIPPPRTRTIPSPRVNVKKSVDDLCSKTEEVLNLTVTKSLEAGRQTLPGPPFKLMQSRIPKKGSCIAQFVPSVGVESHYSGDRQKSGVDLNAIVPNSVNPACTKIQLQMTVDSDNLGKMQYLKNHAVTRNGETPIFASISLLNTTATPNTSMAEEFVGGIQNDTFQVESSPRRPNLQNITFEACSDNRTTIKPESCTNVFDLNVTSKLCQDAVNVYKSAAPKQILNETFGKDYPDDSTEAGAPYSDDSEYILKTAAHTTYDMLNTKVNMTFDLKEESNCYDLSNEQKTKETVYLDVIPHEEDVDNEECEDIPRQGSFEFDDSLGILTPNQMNDFTVSLETGLQKAQSIDDLQELNDEIVDPHCCVVRKRQFHDSMTSLDRSSLESNPTPMIASTPFRRISEDEEFDLLKDALPEVDDNLSYFDFSRYGCTPRYPKESRIELSSICESETDLGNDFVHATFENDTCSLQKSDEQFAPYNSYELGSQKMNRLDENIACELNQVNENIVSENSASNDELCQGKKLRFKKSVLQPTPRIVQFAESLVKDAHVEASYDLKANNALVEQSFPKFEIASTEEASENLGNVSKDQVMTEYLLQQMGPNFSDQIVAEKHVGRTLSDLAVSVTSIDTGYQGDAECDMHSERGTNSAAITPVEEHKRFISESSGQGSSISNSMHSESRPHSKAPDIGSDSDFCSDMGTSWTESELEGGSGGGECERMRLRDQQGRSARVIDGTLYLGSGSRSYREEEANNMGNFKDVGDICEILSVSVRGAKSTSECKQSPPPLPPPPPSPPPPQSESAKLIFDSTFEFATHGVQINILNSTADGMPFVQCSDNHEGNTEDDSLNSSDNNQTIVECSFYNAKNAASFVISDAESSVPLLVETNAPLPAPLPDERLLEVIEAPKKDNLTLTEIIVPSTSATPKNESCSSTLRSPKNGSAEAGLLSSSGEKNKARSPNQKAVRTETVGKAAKTVGKNNKLNASLATDKSVKASPGKESNKEDRNATLKKVKLPKKNVVSKIKEIIESKSIRVINKDASSEEVATKDETFKRPVRTPKKSKWEVVMSKIAAGKAEEKAKGKTKKEVKSKLFMNTSNHNTSLNSTSSSTNSSKSMRKVDVVHTKISTPKRQTMIPKDGRLSHSKNSRNESTTSIDPHSEPLSAVEEDSRRSSIRSSHSDLSLSQITQPSVSNSAHKSKIPRGSSVKSERPVSPSNVSDVSTVSASSRLSSYSHTSRTSARQQNASSVSGTASKLKSLTGAAFNQRKTLQPINRIVANNQTTVATTSRGSIKPTTEQNRARSSLKPSSLSTGGLVKSGHQQPDLLTPSAAATTRVAETGREVARLEALCEAANKDATQAKLQLEQRTKGFEALIVMVKFMTEHYDAFSTISLNATLKNVNKELDLANTTIGQTANEKESLKTRITELVDEHRRELAALTEDHASEIASLKDTLAHNQQNSLQIVVEKHVCEIEELKSQHAKTLENLSAAHEGQLREINDNHNLQLRELREQKQKELEVLQADGTATVACLSAEFETEKEKLLEDHELLKHHCQELEQQKQQMEDCLLQDSDYKLQVATSKIADRDNEIDSLKTVVELRSIELHDLRLEKNRLDKTEDELRLAEERIKKLQARSEDLQEQVDLKNQSERQMSTEHHMLKQWYEKESNVNKRLSMENEELQWRLQQSLESLSSTSLYGTPDSTMSSRSAEKRGRSASAAWLMQDSYLPTSTPKCMVTAATPDSKRKQGRRNQHQRLSTSDESPSYSEPLEQQSPGTRYRSATSLSWTVGLKCNDVQPIRPRSSPAFVHRFGHSSKESYSAEESTLYGDSSFDGSNGTSDDSKVFANFTPLSDEPEEQLCNIKQSGNVHKSHEVDDFERNKELLNSASCIGNVVEAEKQKVSQSEVGCCVNQMALGSSTKEKHNIETMTDGPDTPIVKNEVESEWMPRKKPRPLERRHSATPDTRVPSLITVQHLENRQQLNHRPIPAARRDRANSACAKLFEAGASPKSPLHRSISGGSSSPRHLPNGSSKPLPKKRESFARRLDLSSSDTNLPLVREADLSMSFNDFLFPQNNLNQSTGFTFIPLTIGDVLHTDVTTLRPEPFADKSANDISSDFYAEKVGEIANKVELVSTLLNENVSDANSSSDDNCSTIKRNTCSVDSSTLQSFPTDVDSIELDYAERCSVQQVELQSADAESISEDENRTTDEVRVDSELESKQSESSSTGGSSCIFGPNPSKVNKTTLVITFKPGEEMVRIGPADTIGDGSGSASQDPSGCSESPSEAEEDDSFPPVELEKPLPPPRKDDDEKDSSLNGFMSPRMSAGEAMVTEDVGSPASVTRVSLEPPLIRRALLQGDQATFLSVNGDGAVMHAVPISLTRESSSDDNSHPYSMSKPPTPESSSLAVVPTDSTNIDISWSDDGEDDIPSESEV